MPHPAVVAALASYRLSAELVHEARLLWANGRVARAAALAVVALEADAKADEWIGEVTGIAERPQGEPHRRRIAAGLRSLAGMFDEDRLAAIVGAEGLSTNIVWELRQRALYVDVVDGEILTPDQVTEERASAVIAAAENIVRSRAVLGADPELLTDFFVDYGDAYRTHVEALGGDDSEEAWREAAAGLEAELSERWFFGDDGANVLHRRVQE